MDPDPEKQETRKWERNGPARSGVCAGICVYVLRMDGMGGGWALVVGT